VKKEPAPAPKDENHGFGLLMVEKVNEFIKSQKTGDGLVHINQHLDEDDKEISVDSKSQGEWEEGATYVHELEDGSADKKNVFNQKDSKASKPKKSKKKKHTTGGMDLTAMASAVFHKN